MTNIDKIYLKNKEKILEKVGLPKDFYDYMPPEMLARTLKFLLSETSKEKREEQNTLCYSEDKNKFLYPNNHEDYGCVWNSCANIDVTTNFKTISMSLLDFV